ncbi:Ran-binding protein 3, partial [Fukomys damarensis]
QSSAEQKDLSDSGEEPQGGAEAPHHGTGHPESAGPRALEPPAPDSTSASTPPLPAPEAQPPFPRKLSGRSAGGSSPEAGEDSDREDGNYCPPVKRERTSSLTQLPPSQSEEKSSGFRLKPPTLIHGQAPSAGLPSQKPKEQQRSVLRPAVLQAPQPKALAQTVPSSGTNGVSIPADCTGAAASSSPENPARRSPSEAADEPLTLEKREPRRNECSDGSEESGARRAFVFGQNLRDRVKLMNENTDIADMENAGHPSSETPTATNYFLQYISSSAENSANSADTSSTKFVFGQNMSERVLATVVNDGDQTSGLQPNRDRAPLFLLAGVALPLVWDGSIGVSRGYSCPLGPHWPGHWAYRELAYQEGSGRPRPSLLDGAHVPLPGPVCSPPPVPWPAAIWVPPTPPPQVLGDSAARAVLGLSCDLQSPPKLNEVSSDTNRENAATESGSESSSQEATPEKESLAESAAAYTKATARKCLLEKVEVITGEEAESNVLQIQCKLFVFDKTSQSWVERGRGLLRLNDMASTDDGTLQSRLVMRTQGSLRLILNTKLWAQMQIDKASEKSIRITAMDTEDQGVKVFLISASSKDTGQLYAALHHRILALRSRVEQEQEAQAPAPEPGAPSNEDDSDDDLLAPSGAPGAGASEEGDGQVPGST